MSESRSVALSATAQSRVAEIVETYGDSLRRFVDSRLGTRAEREDIVQEVFTRLAGYEKLDAIHDPRSFLFRIAENVIRDGVRRSTFRQAGAHEPIETDTLRDPAPDQDRALAGKQAVAAFRSALLELDPRRRQAFLLSRVDGLRYRDIADRMGLSAKTIEKYIAEALAHFRRRLGPSELGEATPHASSRDRGARR